MVETVYQVYNPICVVMLGKKMQAQGDREVGIEIEMEGEHLNIRAAGWDTKDDGSLRGDAYQQRAEYVINPPVKRKHVQDQLNVLADALKNAGSELHPSDRCGVHIHINCQKLTEQQVINYLTLYFILEDLLVHYCGEDRVGNLFCLRSSDAEDVLLAIVEAAKIGTLRNIQNDNFRYASVNVTSLYKYGSLEFRAMRSPVDFSVIKEWVDILLAIKDKSLEYGTPRDIVESFSALGANQFTQQVLGDLAKRLPMENADRLIIAGVRRAQDIAYSPANVKPIVEKKAGQRGIFIGGNPWNIDPLVPEDAALAQRILGVQQNLARNRQAMEDIFPARNPFIQAEDIEEQDR